MKSEFFSMFGIPPTECEIEARKDELGVPRLWFRSTGSASQCEGGTCAQPRLYHPAFSRRRIRR